MTKKLCKQLNLCDAWVLNCKCELWTLHECFAIAARNILWNVYSTLFYLFCWCMCMIQYIVHSLFVTSAPYLLQTCILLKNARRNDAMRILTSTKNLKIGVAAFKSVCGRLRLWPVPTPIWLGTINVFNIVEMKGLQMIGDCSSAQGTAI